MNFYNTKLCLCLSFMALHSEHFRNSNEWRKVDSGED
jgi:hypothetical protein